MSTFDFDEFDPFTTAGPYREGRFGGVSLCAGCKHSHVHRRRSSPDPSVYCHELGKYVPPDIVECNQFSAVAALSLHQIQKIALPIDPRPGIDDRSYR